MKKSTDATTPANTTVVYCGPTIIGIAKQFSTYTNGIPAALANKAKEIPAIAALVIPIDELPKVREQLRSGKGSFYAIYTEVQRIIKGGK
ncbi:MAG: hypothetical protein CVU91_07415 [Firmicutes bacterium HGW-Firmicutes-16]|nr:MAG: hypothetical protein CVU91_07415 [Firmicutes bacterium HGW-Firmicutes-16]